MKLFFYSVKDFEKQEIEKQQIKGFEVKLSKVKLTPDSAVLASGYDGISVFTDDDVSAATIEKLHQMKIKCIAIRATGYDNIDREAAALHDIPVYNVPDYSPVSIAEHSLLLMLALSRKLKRSQELMQTLDFSIDELIGETISGKTIGIVGTGKIGKSLIALLSGFNVRILAHDIKPDPRLALKKNIFYTSIEVLCANSDIISLHLPLDEDSHHLIDHPLMQLMKENALIINTARGAIIDTDDLIDNLKTGKIAGAALDVYEFEKGIFFYNHHFDGIKDERLKTLLAMKNVVITPHQAFATHQSLSKIAAVTFHNFYCFNKKMKSGNEIKATIQLMSA